MPGTRIPCTINVIAGPRAAAFNTISLASFRCARIQRKPSYPNYSSLLSSAANKLELSEHTVRNYLLRIYDKLGISSRVELVLCSRKVPSL